MPIINDISIASETRPTLFSSSRNQKDVSLRKQSLSSDAPVAILSGDWAALPRSVKLWARKQIELCRPEALHIMDGSLEEDQKLKEELVQSGRLIRLTKYENCFLARTDPKDVARVESRTVISTPQKLESIPPTAEGVEGRLGKWMSPRDLDAKVQELFPGCMQGRTMYLVPFSMGPIGGKLSKNGIELTDSSYVAVSMRVMTRVGSAVLKCIAEDNGSFVKCLHTVGQPLKPGQEDMAWPCNPEKVLVAHKPHSAEIISFGSGYGGNSLLGKKCFALRIGSTLAKKEGWLAEHMLIMGLKRPGQKDRRYITAAFPSACGKTNLAMLNPSLKGYEATCVGDDIAWLRFDQYGDLRAINPENGFFGVAPGTSNDTNPVAMQSIMKDTVFTNVALTDDGGVWWEGMTKEAPSHLIDWHGNDWTPDCGRKAAHPNSRFCAPAANCPILDEAWEDPKGVKIEAILFGGRRPEGVPLVTESLNWEHGVFIGASCKSEATAAAEHKGKVIMHDPFSMRPFFGYNFGDYVSHWLSLGKNKRYNLPKIFNVNWFRKGANGQGFLWPGFGENIRVLDWIFRRCDGENIAVKSPIGYLPKENSIDLDGLTEKVDMEELFSTPSKFWTEEVAELRQYFSQQVGASLPQEITSQLDSLEKRFNNEE